MKRIYCILISIPALFLLAASCNETPREPDPVTISVNLMLDGEPFAQEGVTVTLSDNETNFVTLTDAAGSATFFVREGSYTASATLKSAHDGVRIVYNGSNNAILVTQGGETSFQLPLVKVESRQIIIKELYSMGCLNPETQKGYTNDAYIVLYNNSDVEADASDIVFTFAAPYNSWGSTNARYYDTEGRLIYENADWIPAYGAIWWFTQPVRIPAYSQIVVVCFSAIDHTLTVPGSVKLDDPSYYWMSNSGVSAYTHAKYAVSENIASSHYLSCVPFTQGTAWALSVSSPAFYIGRMSSSEAKALSENTEAFDHTLGTTAPWNVVKFPKAKVEDAVEVWSAANLAASVARLSADINTGHVSIANNNGYTVYRNVDKEATEALPENEGKLVYGYSGGTLDVEGSTDPSGIDAEASIAAGAHIIFSDTNDSGKDFHQRKVASLKK